MAKKTAPSITPTVQVATTNTEPKDYNSTVSYIRETILNLKNNAIKDLLFVTDESQEANTKFSNAMKSYMNLEPDEECILIFDNTAFKSAKDGFVLTNKSIQYHNMWTKPGKIYYKDIDNINNIQLSSSDLKVSGKDINITLVPKANRQEFWELIVDLISRLK